VQKNFRPRAVKRGAGTDLARSTGHSGSAKSEKRGMVNYLSAMPPDNLVGVNAAHSESLVTMQFQQFLHFGTFRDGWSPQVAFIEEEQ
jgi:hypothetical protein